MFLLFGRPGRSEVLRNLCFPAAWEACMFKSRFPCSLGGLDGPNYCKYFGFLAVWAAWALRSTERTQVFFQFGRPGSPDVMQIPGFSYGGPNARKCCKTSGFLAVWEAWMFRSIAKTQIFLRCGKPGCPKIKHNLRFSCGL